MSGRVSFGAALRAGAPMTAIITIATSHSTGRVLRCIFPLLMSSSGPTASPLCPGPACRKYTTICSDISPCTESLLPRRSVRRRGPRLELGELACAPGEQRDHRPVEDKSGRDEASGEEDEYRRCRAGQWNGDEHRRRSARDHPAASELDRP